MAAFSNLSLTEKGAEALLAAQAGETLTLSKIGMGSGIASSIFDLTALVEPKLMLDITEKKVVESDEEGTSGHMLVSARMSNEDLTEGFYWKEIGLFFQDEDGNDVLFSYACISGEQYDYVPPYSDERYVKHIRIANIVTDGVNITIKENSNLQYVDTYSFEEYKNEIRVELRNYAKLDGEAANMITTFQNAATRENIVSGEKLGTSLGKIAKWFIDFAKVAFSGNYQDLNNKPQMVNNDTTEDSTVLAGARIVKIHGDEIDKLVDNLKALSSNGAVTGIEVKEDGAYITYTLPGGADTVTKKLGSFEKTLLKTLTANGTVDCTGIDGYGYLTVDNFVIEVTKINGSGSYSGTGTTGVHFTAGGSASASPTKSYDASTGVLTVSGLSGSSSGDVGGEDGDTEFGTTSGSCSCTVNVYCIHS